MSMIFFLFELFQVAKYIGFLLYYSILLREALLALCPGGV